jgi:pre-mRNA cleavage complex 2 protein Pcf11
LVSLHATCHKIASLIYCAYGVQNIQHTQRDPFGNPDHEKQSGKDPRGLGFSHIPQKPVLGPSQIRSKPTSQDGNVGPYHATDGGSSEHRLDRRRSLYVKKDSRSAGSACLDGALLPTPSISDIIDRPSSNKNWKLAEEEEYVWDNVQSQAAEYGSTNTVRKGEWIADDGNAKYTNFERAKWAEVGAVKHIDPNLQKLDNLRRFGHATVQGRRMAAYMVCELKLLEKCSWFSVIILITGTLLH